MLRLAALPMLLPFLTMAIVLAMAAFSVAQSSELKKSEPVELSAGSIRMKFEEGQIRYLRVGDTEIVRRIYFATRDGQWTTIPPTFTVMQVQKGDDHFTVTLAADCKQDPVDLHWEGQIVGAADGTITYHVKATAQSDFQSNRIGLCVLLGTPALAGSDFETIEKDGADPVAGQFPTLVKPTLVAQGFTTIRYLKTIDGVSRCQVAVSSDVPFEMEDQRNWGDSSYKAYNPLRFAYPSVHKGQTLEQTIRLSFTKPTTGLITRASEHWLATPLRIGSAIQGSRIPKLVSADAFAHSKGFVDTNRSRASVADAPTAVWSYTSLVHLEDDDTLMENPPALLDQARTMRSFAPYADLNVGPITAGHGNAGRPIAAAWAVSVMANLAEGGVKEAAFDLGQGPAATVLDDFKPYAGREVLSVSPVSLADPSWDVQGLAVQDGSRTIVWVANREGRNSVVRIGDLGGNGKLLRLSQGVSAESDVVDGTIKLAPYEVVRVTAATK